MILGDSSGNYCTYVVQEADSGSMHFSRNIRYAQASFDTYLSREFYRSNIDKFDAPGYVSSVKVTTDCIAQGEINKKKAASTTAKIIKYSGKVVSYVAKKTQEAGLGKVAGAAAKGASWVGYGIILYDQFQKDMHPYNEEIPNGTYDQFTVTVKGFITSYVGGNKRIDMYEMQFICYRTSCMVSGVPIETYIKDVIFTYE